MKNFDTKWESAKKQFQLNWKALEPDELEQTHGDTAALAKLLQRKYALAYEQALEAVLEIMPRFENAPSLPDTEEPQEPDEFRKIEGDERPVYPNKLYEEELPPDIKLDTEE